MDKLILENQMAMMTWMMLTGMASTKELREQIKVTCEQLEASKTIQQSSEGDHAR